MRADPDALVACPGGTATERLVREHGLSTAPVPFRPLVRSRGRAEALRSLWRTVLAARELRRVLRSHPERTVVYGVSMRAGIQASLAALGLRGRRLVWSLHDPMPGPALAALVRALALARCELVVACSAYVASAFAGRSRALRRKTVVVHTGIDSGRFAGVEPARDRPAAVMVGSVIPEKRVEVALEVAAQAAASRPDFRLEIVGGPRYHAANLDYLRALEERASTGPLAGHVRFCGHQDDVPTALARAAVLLHCRDDEPFALTILEAMAAGLPVVAPRGGGVPEAVVDGVTGVLYRPGDADAAAASMLALLADPERARRLGEAGRALVAERFSLPAYLRRHAAALEPVRPALTWASSSR